MAIDTKPETVTLTRHRPVHHGTRRDCDDAETHPCSARVLFRDRPRPAWGRDFRPFGRGYGLPVARARSPIERSPKLPKLSSRASFCAPQCRRSKTLLHGSRLAVLG